MHKNKSKLIQCQISIEKLEVNDLQQFEINRRAANDESLIVTQEPSKCYSIKKLMNILGCSTIKEVEYLIKKLGLNHPKYRCNNFSDELLFNEKALQLLHLYLKFKAS